MTTRGGGLLSSPLLQFLAIGLVVYGLVSWQMPDAPQELASSADDRTIRVERDELLAYVQLRSGEADAVALERSFDELSDASQQAWIDRYVREEALVREARRLGLDRDDDLIRRRLVQQMEFIAVDARYTEDAIRDAEISAYYREHAEDFREAAYYTFDHVYFRAGSESVSRAGVALARLGANEVPAEELSSMGDRFLYNRRYAERTEGEVISHFGKAFAESLAKLEPAADWLGPLESDHGLHLIRLGQRVPSALRPLEEAAPEIRRELARQRQEAALDAGVAAILSRYAVEVASPGSPRD